MERLTLAAAAKAAGVSQVTLRKHIAAGRLAAERERGRYGMQLAIDAADLAAFVQEHYERDLDLAGVEESIEGKRSVVTMPTPQAVIDDLRGQLDTTLAELGKYRALTEQAGEASAHVEDLLKERIAELQSELTTARDELARAQALSWWGRLWGRR
jgi:hypothetical protein